MSFNRALWDKMSPQEKVDEYKKCEESLVYFYNNYVRKDDQPEMTELQYEQHMAQVEAYRNGRHRHRRSPFTVYPVLTKQAYNPNKELKD